MTSQPDAMPAATDRRSVALAMRSSESRRAGIADAPATTADCRTTRRTSADAARRTPARCSDQPLVAPAVEEALDVGRRCRRPGDRTRGERQARRAAARAARTTGGAPCCRRGPKLGRRAARPPVTVSPTANAAQLRVGGQRTAERPRRTIASPSASSARRCRMARRGACGPWPAARRRRLRPTRRHRAETGDDGTCGECS